MEQSIAFLLAAGSTFVAVGVAWGMMKVMQANNAKKLDDHETRMRSLEQSKPQYDAHIAEAVGVTERLRGIEGEIREMRAELRQRDRDDTRIVEALEANRMVLSDVAARMAVMESTLERNGK